MNVAKLFRHPEIKATRGISSSQSTSKPNCKYKLLRNINIIYSSHALIQLLIEKKKSASSRLALLLSLQVCLLGAWS